MSKVRLLVLSLLAVLSIGAVASASASAETCKEEAGTKKFALCLGTTLELTEASKIDMDVRTSGSYVLSFDKGLEIACPKILETLTLTSAATGAINLSSFKLHFVECKLDKPANCKLREELILWNPLVGRIVGAEEVEFSPATGRVFFTVTIVENGGACLIGGKYNVAGAEGKEKVGPMCALTEANKTKTLHLIKCSSAKSSLLEFALEPATFEGTFDTTLLNASKETLLAAIVEGK